jgi:hypothetical protein
MEDRETRSIDEGHFISLPKAFSDGFQSETLWHTKANRGCSAWSIPLPASDRIPPTPNGITIFTCVRLACKRKEVKGKFCGGMGKFSAKAQSCGATGTASESEQEQTEETEAEKLRQK